MEESVHSNAPVETIEKAPRDEVFVRQVLAGDRDAYAHLVERYLPVIERFLAMRGLRGADLDDALQNTMVIAYQRLGRLRNPNCFGSYLFKIARNAGPTRKRLAVSLNDIDEPADIRQREDSNEALQAAIARLPDKLQFILALKYTKEMTAAEIADRLGQTVGSVTKSLSRAYQRLRNDPVLTSSADGGETNDDEE